MSNADTFGSFIREKREIKNYSMMGMIENGLRPVPKAETLKKNVRGTWIERA